jgi:class 3 adenylate cyclase
MTARRPPSIAGSSRCSYDSTVAPTTGTATIVFTDLAASTELRAGLGEGAADNLRRQHDAALAAAVAAHRGRVVKGAGDGILAAFDSASDGVLAAVAMQQAVYELGRRHRLRLAMRVGISAGDVSWEGGDCFGLPVVEAARLEAAAEPRQIVCADIVRILARGRADVQFGPSQSLVLKGLAEPVSACEIAWTTPPTAPTASALPLIGRSREMSIVMEAWDRARAGSGGAVLVAGEPGIGKTRLLEEVASRVALSGGIVWWGAAYEGEVRAYGPITEMVDAYIRVTEPDVLARQLGPAAGLVARLAPNVRDRLDVTDPVPLPADAERERTVDALVEFAAAMTSTTPLLVVVDDAHWADASTVGLLRTLVRRAGRLAVLVLVAYRDVELDRRHPLAGVLADWRRQPLVVRMGLRGLDRDGVGELAAVVADTSDVPAEIVSAISDETDGNPFFVREVLLHLIEDGAPDRWASASIAQVEIPEGVRETIGRRLSRLSHDTNRLLAVASACEAGFRLDDVAAVVGLADDAALDAIDEALDSQMVRPGDGFDRYEFVHALIRHTLWAELNPSRQVRLHRAIAEQIEKRTGHEPTPDEVIALAYHFHYSAALPGAERGVGYALMAADQAAIRFAPSEELHAVAIALELLPSGDDRERLLHERAARAAILARQWPTAVDHAGVAVDEMALGNGPASACELAVALGRLAELVEANAGWPFGHLVERHRHALEPSGVAAVQLLAWDVAEAEYNDPDNPGIATDTPERRRMNDLAGRLPPDQRPRGFGGYFYPSAAAQLADYEQGQTDAAWASALIALPHYREAADVIRHRVDSLLASGYWSGAVPLLAMVGRLHLVLGELDRAANIQAEGEQLLERVEPDSNVTVQLGGLSTFREMLVDRDFRKALERVDRNLALSYRPDLRWGRAARQVWAASLHAALGDQRQALQALPANIAILDRAFVGATNYPMIVHFAAQILWSTEHPDYVDVVERNLHTKVLQPDFSYPESDGRWTAALLCALSGRYDDARGWFQQSYDRVTAQEALLLIPHVCCDEALMEVRRGRTGDRANGLRRLDEARRWVDQIGLPNLLPRIDDLQARLVE